MTRFHVLILLGSLLNLRLQQYILTEDLLVPAAHNCMLTLLLIPLFLQPSLHLAHHGLLIFEELPDSTELLLECPPLCLQLLDLDSLLLQGPFQLPRLALDHFILALPKLPDGDLMGVHHL